MNPHFLRRSKESDCKPVLHQWLTTTQGQPTIHDFESMAILTQCRNCTPEWNCHSDHHVPRVGVVAVQAPELASRGPCHEANTRTTDSRTGCERGQDSNVTRFACF